MGVATSSIRPLTLGSNPLILDPLEKHQKKVGTRPLSFENPSTFRVETQDGGRDKAWLSTFFLPELED